MKVSRLEKNISNDTKHMYTFCHFLVIAGILFSLSGCATNRPVPLMEAPVIYQNAQVDPYAHLEHEKKTTVIPVFYATNREPIESGYGVQYGNDMSDSLHLGVSVIRFGDYLINWDDLYLASTELDPPSSIFHRFASYGHR
ncbi:MAG: hypothetical protein ACI8ZB_001977 [Desulforhopalus sp.]|jgi:hypothetical protein